MRLKIAYFLASILLLAGHNDALASQETFKVGIVPQFDARKIYDIWTPILSEIEKKTGYKLILEGAPTIPDFENEFLMGKFDFAYMNPYHILIAKDKQGYIPLVRDTGRTLHGILVVRKDSPYQSLKDLDKQNVAFPAPNALGASLMIRADLAKNHNSHVIPSYVKTHSSVYLNVALGLASAGGGVQKTFDQQPDEIRNELKIIYKTQEVSPHPFSAHPRVPAEAREKILRALLELGTTPQGQALLKNVPIKKIGPASMSDYEPLGKLGLDRYYER